MINLPRPPASSSTWPWISRPQKEPSAYELARLPTISIVTPFFNQGEFLEETVRSVLLQGYQKVQYVVIDGGSTDQSIEIHHRLDGFDSSYRFDCGRKFFMAAITQNVRICAHGTVRSLWKKVAS